MVSTTTHDIHTAGQGDAHDVTTMVVAALRQSSISAGLATVSVTGSTAAVTTIEFEPGAVADLNALLERLAPRQANYRHHLRWGDDNGSSHVRAALLGPSVSIPFTGGKLLLGQWQQIMVLELDTRARRRQVIVQLIGE